MSKMSGVSTLLTVLGGIGVIATAVMTAKDSTKARNLLIDAEMDKGDKLTTKEKVLVAAPAYIPTIVAASATITCIFGANFLNKRAQASLASAYALLDASYKEYRRKVDDIHGEGSDDAILSELAKDEYEATLMEDIPEGELLFWDPSSRRYFTSTIDQVIQKVEMEDGMEAYIISTPFDVPPSYWL